MQLNNFDNMRVWPFTTLFQLNSSTDNNGKQYSQNIVGLETRILWGYMLFILIILGEFMGRN